MSKKSYHALSSSELKTPPVSSDVYTSSIHSSVTKSSDISDSDVKIVSTATIDSSSDYRYDSRNGSSIFKKSTGARQNSRLSTKDIQKGGGYQIILEQSMAKIFKSEIVRLKELIAKGRIDKQHYVIKNSSTYIDAYTHIGHALEFLKNDISKEKLELESLRVRLLKLSQLDMFYPLTNPVLCSILLDNTSIPAQLVAVDDGAVAVVSVLEKSGDVNKGDNFIVTLNDNLQIVEQTAESINSVEIEENRGGGRPTQSDRSIFSKSSSSISSNSSKSVSSSQVKLDSPPTESSLTTTSITSTVKSPYLASSEYDIFKPSTKDESTDESISVKESTTRSSSISIDSSSNRSEFHQMKGGSKNKRVDSKSISKNTDSDVKRAIKFMKAGRSDKVGILETDGSSERSGSYYYSESTSIEDGLCE